MSRRRIIRAWKDPAFRRRLSGADRAAMPANPAGAVSLDDADLGFVAGGVTDTIVCWPTAEPPCSLTQLCMATGTCGTCPPECP